MPLLRPWTSQMSCHSPIDRKPRTHHVYHPETHNAVASCFTGLAFEGNNCLSVLEVRVRGQTDPRTARNLTILIKQLSLTET